MNAVVPFQPNQAPAPSFTMSDMERIALAIAKGGLFGSTDPNAVLTLCMVAQAEGKHPGLVMQQYDLIQGKPAKKAQAMQVDFQLSGGTIEWHQLDDEAADATFSHPAGGSVRIKWDMARAQKAGLGGKDMWKKFPRQMLRSRTISEGVRTVFPGATSGMYVPEEVADFDNGPRAETPLTPQPQRARDMKPAKAKAEEPSQIEHKPEPASEDENRTTWEKWVADYKARVAKAASLEEVEKIHRKADAAAADLKALFPDLYAEQMVDFRPSDAPEADAFAGGE